MEKLLEELDRDQPDFYNYAFGEDELLFKSLRGYDLSSLPVTHEKIEIQKGLPKTLRRVVPKYADTDFDSPRFWINIDHLEGFKRTFDNGIKRFYCKFAAEYGSFECLKWATESGCLDLTDRWICRDAAKGGNLDCLKYLRDQGCKWDCWTLVAAAQMGHFEILKWAYHHGCPWHVWVYDAALRGGHFEILEWAQENGLKKGSKK